MNVVIDGHTISYPDLGFAFNPIRVFINNYSGSISLESNGLKIDRESYVGSSSVSFDLSAIAKSLFDSSEFHQIQQDDTILYKELPFTLSNNNGFQYSGSIPIIWGALQIGEVYTQNKTLTYFKGFPFTVPLYIESDMFIQYKSDGGDAKDIGLLTKGKHNINISGINANSIINFISSNDERYKIFDYTFDFTFGPQRVLIPNSYLDININVVDCPNEGVYLRWINKHGEYNYYLFQISSSSVTTKNNPIYLETLYYTTSLTDNYHPGTGKSIGKDIEYSQRLFASLVDSETFDMLQSLTESPVVDLFVGYKNNIGQWVSVSIQEGTFAKSNAVLQDFEIYLLPPKKQVQIL